MKIDHPRPGQLPHLKQLWQEAFGDTDDFLATFFNTAYSPSRCLCIWQDKQVLSAAYWLDCSYKGGKLAYIYAVATAENHRGQGLSHRLLEAIHEKLKKEGYCATILVPGSAGLRNFYAGMGYIPFGGIRSKTHLPGEHAVQLRHVPPLEYARLRRKYLPQGGVSQAGSSIRFLSKQADLAAGDDFVISYRFEQGKLWALEILGNSDAAPGILKALGASQGCFRSPGEDPFAMYRPLKQIQAPTYFGLAFD